MRPSDLIVDLVCTGGCLLTALVIVALPIAVAVAHARATRARMREWELRRQRAVDAESTREWELRRQQAAAAESTRATDARPASWVLARPDRVGTFPADAPLGPVVAIDVETTGRNVETARIVEIAFVTTDGREFASLVKPGVKIPKAAAEIHGITNADVASAPSFVEVWDRARALGLLSLYPLAYHAPYDQRVIAAELARQGRLDDSHLVLSLEWVDPCVVVKHSDDGSARLSEACIRRGIRIGRAHRALDDARAALALWRALEVESPRFTVEPLAHAIGWQEQVRAMADAERGSRN